MSPCQYCGEDGLSALVHRCDPSTVREKTLAEVRGLVEKAAQSHDDLAKRYPASPDKLKADTLRRWADVFLPKPAQHERLQKSLEHATEGMLASAGLRPSTDPLYPATQCATCDQPFFGSSCPTCRRNPDERDKPVRIAVYPSVSALVVKATAEARHAALEDAARILEAESKGWIAGPYDDVDVEVLLARQATAIRALSSKTESKP